MHAQSIKVINRRATVCSLNSAGSLGASKNQAKDAIANFSAGLNAPVNLGEAKHLLANQSDIHFWLGCAYDAKGEAKLARHHWKIAATFKGDFQAMRVRTFSEIEKELVEERGYSEKFKEAGVKPASCATC